MIFGLLSLVSSRSWPLKIPAAFVLGAIALVPLYQIYRSVNGALYGIVSIKLILALHIALAIGILFLFIRSPKRLWAGFGILFMILCPVFFAYAGQAVWLYDVADAHFGPGKVAGMLPAAASHNRVIWIVFDEMDYRLLFPARPARIKLPHFDALRRISIFGDHVKSPAHNTIAAMPALLLARDVPNDGSVDFTTRHLRVRFSGCSQFVSIESQPNVFRSARKLGYNTAVSGWYQPYCRLFGSDLSACATQYGGRNTVGVQKFLRPRSLWEKSAFLAAWQARATVLQAKAVATRSDLNWRILSIPGRSYMNRRLHIARLRSELQESDRMLRNTKLNFVLLHFSIPHPPGIWDPKRQTFTTSDQSNYIDNLALSDYVLGKIRETLVQTGDWDRSTILVSADHPFRPTSWLAIDPGVPPPQAAPSHEMLRLTHRVWHPYIPFLLKLPGENTGIEYHREFNSVLSANLLLAALKGDIRTTAQAVQWLEAHAVGSEEEVCR